MSARAPVKTAAVSPPVNAGRTARPAITPVRSAMLQRACACGAVPGTGGKCDDCNKKDKQAVVQRASNGGPQPSGIPPVVNQALGSAGRPMDRSTQDFMGSRFGHDFSQVRIHDDSLAADSARAVNAKAYTVGQDVFFGSGQYLPGTQSGNSLLAHELAHTMQQSGVQHSKENVAFTHDSQYDHLEREADSAAHSALNGSAVRISPVTSPIISRKKGDADENKEEITKAKPTKPKTKDSSLGKHKVTPTETLTTTEGAVEEFEVDPLYLPGIKGPKAKDEYEKIAGGKLEAVQEVISDEKSKTMLKQKREVTEDLRSRWLAKVGWSSGDPDELWHNLTGGPSFPRLKKASPPSTDPVCQMDHIVELQLGGDNTNENIQALDPSPNQSSGSQIRGQLDSLTIDIANDKTLSKPVEDGVTKQIKLRFMSVKILGALKKPQGSCPPTGNICCLDAEACAKEGIEEVGGKATVKKIDYKISVGGGSDRIVRVPTDFAKSDVPVEMKGDNEAVATIIPGLLLTQLAHEGKGKKARDVILAKIDDREGTGATRLPISLANTKTPIKLIVGEGGVLKLDPALKKNAGLAFTYKYLSAGQIGSVNVDESGELAWTGYITPSVPFIKRLDVSYNKGVLSITKGLKPNELKQPFPGVRIAEATVGIQLSPEFKPEGKLVFLFGGTESKPLAKATLTVSTDGVGIVADGLLQLFIPGVDKAEADVTYKGGGEYGAGQWTAEIVIESSQIKLPYVQSGSIKARLASGKGVVVDGKLNLNLPGDNVATVGVYRDDDAWILSGGGRFKAPKIPAFTATVVYNTATKKLVAEAKDINFKIFDIDAQLKSITGEFQPGKSPVFYGSGSVEIKKGKVVGGASVTLNKDGKFTGKGTVIYTINENMKASVGVEIDEQERLKFAGELVVSKIKLFDQFGDTKELFSLDMEIPVPGASIGPVGLEVTLGGGVSVGYTIGPGTIAPLILSADFYPLEDNPDPKFGVKGSLNLPASMFLSANVRAGIELSAYIAKVGGELVLTGTLTLDGGIFVPFEAKYESGDISGKITPELKFKLLLGLALSIHAWAKAGVGWFSVKTGKTWDILKKTVDTHLGFSVKAPISYSTKTGPKFPTLDQVEITKPDLSMDNMKRILKELVGDSDPPEKEV